MANVEKLIGDIAALRSLVKDLKFEFKDQKISQINLNANFVQKFEQVDCQSRQFERWKRLMKIMHCKIQKQSTEINLLTKLLGAKIHHQVCQCGRIVNLIQDSNAAVGTAEETTIHADETSRNAPVNSRNDSPSNSTPTQVERDKKSLLNIRRATPRDQIVPQRKTPRSSSESTSVTNKRTDPLPAPPATRPRPPSAAAVVTKLPAQFQPSAARDSVGSDSSSHHYDAPIPVGTGAQMESNIYMDMEEVALNKPSDSRSSSDFSVTYTSDMLAMSGRPLPEDPQSGPLEVVNVLGRWDFQTHPNYQKNEKETWKNIVYDGKGFLPSRRLLLPVEWHSLIIYCDIEAIDKKHCQLSIFVPNYSQNRTVRLPVMLNTQISVEGPDGLMMDCGTHGWRVDQLNHFAEPNECVLDVKNFSKKKFPKITFQFI